MIVIDWWMEDEVDTSSLDNAKWNVAVKGRK